MVDVIYKRNSHHKLGSWVQFVHLFHCYNFLCQSRIPIHHDWYSGIEVTAGFDIDLNGINDQNVSASSGFEDVIFIPFNVSTDESETGSRVISFRFGAMSSENIWSDNPIQYHIVTGNFDTSRVTSTNFLFSKQLRRI